MKTITRKQARQFILRKQGLLGNHRFAGKTVRMIMFVRWAASSMILWTYAERMQS